MTKRDATIDPLLQWAQKVWGAGTTDEHWAWLMGELDSISCALAQGDVVCLPPHAGRKKLIGAAANPRLFADDEVQACVCLAWLQQHHQQQRLQVALWADGAMAIVAQPPDAGFPSTAWLREVYERCRAGAQ